MKITTFTIISVLAACRLLGCASLTDRTAIAGAQVITVREAYSNVFVVDSGDGRILIDAGYERTASAVEAGLRGMGVDPSTIQAVIVTHAHADHAGGAAYFRQVFGSKIIVGEGDRAMIMAGRNEKLCATNSSAKSRLEKAQGERFTPFEPDLWIRESMDLGELVGIEGTVFPLAGHTEGSLVVTIGDAAFVGDLFRGSVVGSSAQTSFFMCDLAENTENIRQLLQGYPHVQTFFTGHFGAVSRQAVEKYISEL